MKKIVFNLSVTPATDYQDNLLFELLHAMLRAAAAAITSRHKGNIVEATIDRV